jgi:hypothetical protein
MEKKRADNATLEAKVGRLQEALQYFAYCNATENCWCYEGSLAQTPNWKCPKCVAKEALKALGKEDAFGKV